MREFSRRDRLADQIKREVADILATGMKDPHLGFVTITDVEVTGDLKYAKVFYTVYGDQNQMRESGKVLAKSRGFVQSELAGRLRIRSVPELTFVVDSSAEYGRHMDELFRQIETEREKPPDDDEHD